MGKKRAKRGKGKEQQTLLLKKINNSKDKRKKRNRLGVPTPRRHKGEQEAKSAAYDSSTGTKKTNKGGSKIT